MVEKKLSQMIYSVDFLERSRKMKLEHNRTRMVGVCLVKLVFYQDDISVLLKREKEINTVIIVEYWFGLKKQF